MSEKTGSRSRLAWIAFVVGLLGAIIGGYSTYHQHKLVSDPGYESFCSIDTVFDCDDVNSSRWSTLPLMGAAPIPVSLLGFLLWVTLAWLAWIHARGPEDPGRDTAMAYALLLSLGGLSFSVFMAFVSYVVIQKVCIVCTAWYVVAIAYPILASRAFSGSLSQAAQSVVADLRKSWRRRGGVLAGWLLLAALGSQVPPMRVVDQGRVGGDSEFLEVWKNAPRRSVDLGGAHVKGSRDPQLDVVEFADLECPACRREATVLRKLMKKYPGVVRVAFRHYPLDNACNGLMNRPLHEHACDASLAAECAGQQGEFWAYHDELFTPWGRPKPDLSREGLARSAEVVGLDMDEFSTCMERGAGMARIQADLRAGASIGIRSTPTLVINGRKISKSLTLVQWETIMRAEGIEVASP